MLAGLAVYYFQVQSAVPLYVQPTLVVALSLLGVFLAEYFLLPFPKLPQLVNLILFPVIAVVGALGLNLLPPRIGLTAVPSIDFLTGGIVSWPTIALVVLIGFLLERYNPISYLSYRLYLLAHQYGSSGGGAVHGGLQRSIIVPIFDEAVFRYFAINSLLLLGLSPIVAVGWSAVAYGLSHWSQWHDKRWTGGSSMNTALVLGFLLGVIAVTYGVLVSLAYHVVSNLLYSLFRRFKGTSEGTA